MHIFKLFSIPISRYIGICRIIIVLHTITEKVSVILLPARSENLVTDLIVTYRL